MAQLTGNPIKDSYLGLIKTTDNAALSGTAKAITDGSGGATNIQMSNTATNFVSGTVDFTGSTVSGLPSSGGGTVFQGTPWTLNTQASSDIVYETFMIPGGTFTTGDVLSITGLEYRDGMNNWGYSSLWISDTAQTVGQAPVASSGNYSFAQVQSPDARKNIYYNKTLFIKSNGTMHMPIAGSNNVNAENSGDPTETVNINWAVNQYFFYQFYNDSSTGSITTSGTLIKKLN